MNRPYSLDYARLASGAFYETIVLTTFCETINLWWFRKKSEEANTRHSCQRGNEILREYSLCISTFVSAIFVSGFFIMALWLLCQYKTESFPESAETAEACRKFPMKKSNLGDRYIKIQFFVMILATGDNLPPAEQMF